MNFDDHANFAYSTVAVVGSNTLDVQSGDGSLFPTPPFNATVWEHNTIPTSDNATIIRVTAISGDRFTFTRMQEGSNDREILVYDQITAGITKKTLTDIEAYGGSGNSPFVTVGAADADYITDGTADDVEIQAAIDALGTGGGEIRLKKGTYNLSAPIVIKYSMKLSGEGRRTVLAVASAINAIEIYNETVSIIGLQLQDFRLDGDTTSANYGIYVKAEPTFELTAFHADNIAIDGFDTQFYVDCSMGGLMTNCIFEYGWGDNIGFECANTSPETIKVTFDRCHFEGLTTGLYALGRSYMNWVGVEENNNTNPYVLQTSGGNNPELSVYGEPGNGFHQVGYATSASRIHTVNTSTGIAELRFAEGAATGASRRGLRFTASDKAFSIYDFQNSLDRLTVASGGAVTIPGTLDVQSDVTVPDEAYGVGWDSSLEVPTKNALYDKVQTLVPYTGATAHLQLGNFEVYTGNVNTALGGGLNMLDGGGTLMASIYCDTPDTFTMYTQDNGQDAYFNLADLSAARTFTFPDASGTLALSSDLSTLLSSSAVIVDHTIVRGDGGARGVQDTGITIADNDYMYTPASIESEGAIIVNTISEHTAAAGVSIDSVLLKDGTATLSGDKLNIATAKTPSSAADTGTTGDICWDASYIYVCTATNTWKRVAIATW
jgi:hypothetical protein